MGLRIAVDVGGTFTDGVLLESDSGHIWLAKALTTYTDPGDAVAQVVEALIAQFGRADAIRQLVHGTTLVTNTLLERKGVRTAVVTNAGMADCLEIRRELRYDTYDLGLTYPAPLAARADVHEVAGRLRADGTEAAPLDVAAVESIGGTLAAAGVRAVAVCLLHAPVNGAHEAAVRETLARTLPDASVSISSEVASEIGEYERMSTTVANACVQPVVARYLASLGERFEALGIAARLDVMLSNGGFTSAMEAARFPIRLLESGPAGGVLGAINCAAAHATARVLAFDMGGTTAKSCVAVEGRPEITHTFEFARERRFKKGSGLPVVAPSIDLIEIGAGGGSIARHGALGLLQVGPESAGSEPGPACYALGGTEATVTDADLLLGYLDADEFLGGTMRLDTAAADRALAAVGAPLGLDAVRTARGVHDIVNENMASAARTHIAEKGFDARDFTLVATGGAGPLHAVDVARRLRIARVLCPIAAGVGSCLGFLAAPARADRSWSKVERAAAVDAEAIRARLDEACREMEAELAQAGIAPEAIEWGFVVAMRYAGQGARVEVSLPLEAVPDAASLGAGFDAAYAAEFGRGVPGGVPEVVTWRVSALAGEGLRRFRIGATPSEGALVEAGHRRMYLPGRKGYADVPRHRREALVPGTRLRGPCVVTEAESTLIVAWPAAVAVLDDGTIEIVLDEVSR